MHQQRNNSSSINNNQGNMVLQIENYNSLKTELKVMEDGNLNDREFKRTVMKKFNEIQKQTNKQIKET